MPDARYWQALNDQGDILCTLCPRACRLHPGQRGLCYGRANVGGRMELTTAGRASGFCIDPVEKKPLNHFLPGSPTLSFGTIGCNLTCAFCQNWEISRSRDDERLAVAVTPEEIAYAAVRKGCRSVAMTYNDPVISLEFATEVAKACRAQQIRTVAVTAGYIADAARPEFFAAFDAANVDLKGFTEEFYHRLCSAHLAPVLDTLRHLVHETKVWTEITTLIIPGANDSDAEIAAMARWIAEELSPDVPLHLTAFHPDHRMLDTPPTPAAALARARSIALDQGLRFVYTGNVRDREGATTTCPNCGKPVIRRDGYQITHYNLDMTGHCLHCNAKLPGVFEGWAGNWGNRRQTVDMPIRRCLC